MPSRARERLPPDKYGSKYQQPLRWDDLRERMANAVEQARARHKVPPLRFWEKDWSKNHGR